MKRAIKIALAVLLLALCAVVCSMSQQSKSQYLVKGTLL